jgi:hypothetical protein
MSDNRINEALEAFEGYVTNMAETVEIRDHVYQMIAGFREEQGIAHPQYAVEDVPGFGGTAGALAALGLGVSRG